MKKKYSVYGAVVENREEYLSKLLDEVICLFVPRENGGWKGVEQYDCVDQSLKAIAETRNRNPNYPITVSLADKLREMNLIER